MNRKYRFIFIFLSITGIILSTFLAGDSTSVKQLDPGIVLIRQGQYGEALAYLETIQKSQEKNAQYWVYKGQTLCYLRDWENAVTALEKAVSLDDESAPAFLWLGRACGGMVENVGLFKKMKYGKRSMDACKRAVEIDSSYVEALKSLMDAYLMAPGIAGGSVEKARELAGRIKTLNEAEGHMAFAKIYAKEENFIRQEEELLKAADLDTANAAVFIELGFFYHHRSHFEAALSAFEKALALDSSNVIALFLIGNTSALSGLNPERGAECLTRFIKTPWFIDGRPSLSEAHYFLGMIYEQLEMPDRASREYELTLQLKPDHRDAERALKKIRASGTLEGVS